MQPPWSKFPRIPWGSAGWRMGAGEAYWHSWSMWYAQLTLTEKEQYKSEWPTVDRWLGFYEFIEQGVMPPWLIELQSNQKAAADPPRAGESVIEESHRVFWLIRSYLKRDGSSYSKTDSWVESYSDPEGGKWDFVIPNDGTKSPYLLRSHA